jgi:hypothetical protein
MNNSSPNNTENTENINTVTRLEQLIGVINPLFATVEDLSDDVT